MYETILFPTDGSDESLAALDHALDLAETYGASVHALYVVDTSYPSGDYDGALNWETVIDSFRKQGETVIDTIEERVVGSGVEMVGAVREGGGIHREILEYADENDADLIVIGTHGRRGLDRWLLGSVTERIVRSADIPVLTVRAAGTRNSDDVDGR